MDSRHARRRAAEMLMLATVFWGISFPTMKSLSLLQEKLLPGASSWFLTGLVCALRFGSAGVMMAVWLGGSLRQITALEFRQGLWLGIFGGLGLLVQMDGLAYTPASTSAFLTQCYCLILPVYTALRDRRRPSPLIALCSLMVIGGVAVLAGISPRDLRLGRGEVETLIASVIFTGQILLLEHPRYAGNRVNHFTVVMFAVMALMSLALTVPFARGTEDFRVLLSTPAVHGLVGVLVLFCTMGAYLLMNYWQRFLPATEAGLIYCAEPVFASLFALFLPGWYSRWFGLQYANESMTAQLVLGGGLITAANLFVQLLGNAPPPSAGKAETKPHAP